MSIKYRFSVNGQSVAPIYDNNLSLDYEKEEGQQFFRKKLNGVIKFIGVDYDWIDAQSFSTEFEVLIEKSNDNGATYASYHTGFFYKIDADWNVDDKIVKVELQPKDDYTDVIAGLDKEFSLVDLEASNTKVTIAKRPLLQIYSPGDSVVSCFLSGTWWEQDANVVTDETALVNTYKFGLFDTFYKIEVYGSSSYENILRDYVSENQSVYDGRNIIDDTEPTYKIRRIAVNKVEILAELHGKDASDVGSVWQDSNTNLWQLVEIVDTGILSMAQYFHGSAIPAASDSLTHVRGATHTATINYDEVGTTTATSLYKLNRDSDDALLFYSKFDYVGAPDEEAIVLLHALGSGTLNAYFATKKLYTRTLTGTNTFPGTSYPIPVDDIVPNNRNYNYCYVIDFGDTVITPNASNASTKYGLQNDNVYFAEPTGAAKYFPVGRNTWTYSSIWFNFSSFSYVLEAALRTDYVLNKGNDISDAISTLLNQIDTGLTHDGTAAYSTILYGTNPIVVGNDMKLIINSKRNVLEGELDIPNEEQKITLGDVFDMLRDTFQIYWYIEDSKLKLEHIYFFENGGSYSVTPDVSVDLTTLYNPKNQKRWGFASSKYAYNADELNSRIEFKWMDNCTKEFNGFPIEILSDFAKDANVKKLEISNFTTDIDYLLLQPSDADSDGFALMWVIDNAGTWELPFQTVNIDGINVILQNGYLSWIYIHNYFYRYHLPASSVNINSVNTTATSTIKLKTQSVSFPQVDDPDTLKLIKTHFGDGEIDKISVNLSSRLCKIDLRHDTE